MAEFRCNYQAKITLDDMSSALSAARCHECGITTAELMAKGQLLEVCGEEFSSDITDGTRVLTAIALCPDCHTEFHRDCRGHHNPCQIKARLSREGLD